MTLANKITISRFIFIPLMLIAAYLGTFVENLAYPLFLRVTAGQLVFVFFFMIGAFTDFLDGYYARKRHEVTVFGKFLDPILDKILVLTALNSLLFFPYYREDNLLLSLIILTDVILFTREFFISGIRLVAVQKRTVIAASIWGKIKTATTMVGLIILGLNSFNLKELTKQRYCYLSITILILISLLTLISGLEIIIKSKGLLKSSVKVEGDEFSKKIKYFTKL